VNPDREDLPVTIPRRRTLWLLPALAQAVASVLAASVRSATAAEGDRAPAPSAEPKGRDITQRYLIVNADDFGESPGVNRGIIEAHERGVVTSASLMLDQPATNAAVALARQHPGLSLGLHVNLDRLGRGLLGQERLTVLAREIERQLNAFTALTGSHPTHIDSHHHVHRQLNVARLFLTLSERYGIPLRGFFDVVYLGGFYGQWDSSRPDSSHISVDYLLTLFGKAGPGFTEIGCHPGYADSATDTGYSWQREIELRSLTDSRAKAGLAAMGLRLVNYRDYRTIVGVVSTRSGVAECRPIMAR
jgi:chitin disaccharide deacetylase